MKQFHFITVLVLTLATACKQHDCELNIKHPRHFEEILEFIKILKGNGIAVRYPVLEDVHTFTASGQVYSTQIKPLLEQYQMQHFENEFREPISITIVGQDPNVEPKYKLVN
jgi:hypothetical protein